MTELLQFNVEKTELQREFNEKLSRLRDKWPGMTIDVKAEPLKNNPKIEHRIRIVGKPGNYYW